MQPLSPPVRQLAAVGLLLAVVALIASLTILPVAARIGELSELIEGFYHGRTSGRPETQYGGRYLQIWSRTKITHHYSKLPPL